MNEILGIVVEPIGKDLVSCESRDINGFDEIKQVVGGLVESVLIKPNMIIYCNEEGKLNKSAETYRLLRVASEQNKLKIFDVICGANCIVGIDDNNEICDLSAYQIFKIRLELETFGGLIMESK